MEREARPGSGSLNITCVGCGSTITYTAGEVASADYPEGSLPSAPEHPEGLEAAAVRRRRRPWVLAALGAAAITVLGIAQLGSDDAPEGADGVDSSAPVGQIAPTGEPAEPPSGPDESRDSGVAPAEVRLDRQTFLELFAIGVPRGWTSETVGTEVRISSRRGVATIAVFHQLGERSPKDLAQGAADFLAAQHPGAKIGKTEYLRIGGRRAARVNSSYEGGEETAIMLAGDGYTFVMLRSLAGGSAEAAAAAAEAAISSFKPA